MSKVNVYVPGNMEEYMRLLKHARLRNVPIAPHIHVDLDTQDCTTLGAILNEWHGLYALPQNFHQIKEAYQIVTREEFLEAMKVWIPTPL